MATANPFDLLGDDDNEDPSQLLAAQQQKLPVAQPKKPQQAQPAQPAKLPSKPLPPAQSVREGKYEGGRGGGRGGGGGRGFSRGRGGVGGGFNRDPISNENTNGFSGGYRPSEEGDGKASERRGGYGAPRGSFRGGRRGGYNNGEDGEGERPRRVFDRRSGTGRGNDFKREGSGRGNWGTPSDDIAPETEEPGTETEKNVSAEKQSGENEAADANKEDAVNETEEKEPEEKEMTLEEYQKVLEEKRKALLALKTEERKVDVDKDLKAMQLLSNKKENDEIFIKLGSEKDKRKEAAEKEERAKKSVSINEFLKPAEGERYYGGRGRGRGRGPRGGYSGGPGGYSSNAAAPSIGDPGQFPSLGGK
ncbi:RGG repeats nuclear RNA binding protein A [Pyrus x bretschneideri]|uniref:RGG repeats nuclear RNA binding protein A n=1 Tax=Pyrus x bretschneideri TaxID=225117 RepID=UPI00202F3591|nr:RGG repeats nuclear RNA binding protein A [Pyrus x bretschneideri]